MENLNFKFIRYLTPEIGSALVGGVSSLVGSLVGAEKTEESQMKMVRYMNQYNSPAEQLKRLRQAGLNPALALHNSLSDITGNQGSASSGADYGALGNIGNSAAAAASVAASTDLAKSQAKLAEANAKKVEAEVPWIDQLNSETFKLIGSQNKELLSKIPVNDATAKNLTAELENIKKLGDQIGAQTDLYKSQLGLLDSQKVEQDIINKYADEMHKQGIELSKSQIASTYAQAKSFISAAANANSQARLNDLTYRIEDFLRANGTTYKLREAQAEAAKSGANIKANDATLSNATLALQKQLANLRVMLDLALQAFNVASVPVNTQINAVGAVAPMVGK